MRFARGEVHAEVGPRSATVWLNERVRLARTRELVSELTIVNKPCERPWQSTAWSRLTLGVTQLRRRTQTGPDGPAPAVRFELDAFIAGGRREIEYFRWSPAAWSEAGLLVAWSGPLVLGFELRAWQESGEDAELGLQWVADAEGAPATVTLGVNVAAV